MLSKILAVPSATELLNILDSISLSLGFSDGVTPGKTSPCGSH